MNFGCPGEKPSRRSRLRHSGNYVVVACRTKQFCRPTKPFSASHANILKRRALRTLSNDAADFSSQAKWMEIKMRTLSLMILAFTLVLSGASVAGSSDTAAPHAGLFQVAQSN